MQIYLIFFLEGHYFLDIQYTICMIVQRKLYCLKLEKTCDIQLYTEGEKMLNSRKTRTNDMVHVEVCNGDNFYSFYT